MIVTTIHGDMDDSLLTRKDGAVDDEREHTTWTEYWLKDELVHRSVHVRLKQGIGIEAAMGQIG